VTSTCSRATDGEVLAEADAAGCDDAVDDADDDWALVEELALEAVEFCALCAPC
jgi:hypothetical protein